VHLAGDDEPVWGTPDAAVLNEGTVTELELALEGAVKLDEPLPWPAPGR
jgi:hypothetical protein